MAEFKVIEDKDGSIRIYQISPNIRPICPFEDKYSCLAGDICDFLNDKYCDKNVNEEWGRVKRLKRIKYHFLELIKLIFHKYSRYNEHGNGVE